MKLWERVVGALLGLATLLGWFLLAWAFAFLWYWGLFELVEYLRPGSFR